MIRIELLNQQNQIISGKIDHEKDIVDFAVQADELCVLGIKDYQYQLGDKIRVTTENAGHYFIVQLDETLAPSLLYLAGQEWFYELPLAEELRKSAVETAFTSHRHHLMVRKAYDFEITNRQNLSFNTHDQKIDSGAFPHASANIETRGESVFFAKNAIDGKLANFSHGSYPFTSWGINQRKDAKLRIDFGRRVAIDQLALLFRNDCPHDSYWTSVEVVFSNKTSIILKTKKDEALQHFAFPTQVTRFVILRNLKKADDDSPFPALTQIEVFGKNILEK